MVEKSHTAGWLPHVYEPLRNLRTKIADWFAPPSEASSVGDQYEISLELPGVDPEQIDVSLEGDSLTVKGEKHSEHTEDGRTYFFSEREYGAFLRTFRLPPDADADGVSANYIAGVLTLRVPKRTRTSDGRKRITVKRA